jgi:hypothetical protein
LENKRAKQLRKTGQKVDCLFAKGIPKMLHSDNKFQRGILTGMFLMAVTKCARRYPDLSSSDIRAANTEVLRQVKEYLDQNGKLADAVGLGALKVNGSKRDAVFSFHYGRIGRDELQQVLAKEED